VKKFILDEVSKAIKRLQAIFVFTARCLFITFLNLLVVVIPTVMVLFYILSAVAGQLTTEEKRVVSPQAYSVRSYSTSPLNVSQTLQSFTRDLNTWISELRLFKK